MLPQLFLGYWIIAAGVSRLAAAYPFDAQPAPFNRAKFGYCLTGVFRAGRVKPAAWPQERTDQILVAFDQPDH